MTTDQKLRRANRILRRIEVIKAIMIRLGGLLEGLSALAGKYVAEIEEDGDMSQETCMVGTELFNSAENDTLKVLRGLYSLHESSGKLVPDGMNEGNKEWPF